MLCSCFDAPILSEKKNVKARIKFVNDFKGPSRYDRDEFLGADARHKFGRLIGATDVNSDVALTREVAVKKAASLRDDVVLWPEVFLCCVAQNVFHRQTCEHMALRYPRCNLSNAEKTFGCN